MVSDRRANDFQPAFDPTGKDLFFISTPHENPTFSRAEFNIAALKTTGIYVAPLNRGLPSAFAPQSDEATTVLLRLALKSRLWKSLRIRGYVSAGLPGAYNRA